MVEGILPFLSASLDLPAVLAASIALRIASRVFVSDFGIRIQMLYFGVSPSLRAVGSNTFT